MEIVSPMRELTSSGPLGTPILPVSTSIFKVENLTVGVPIMA